MRPEVPQRGPGAGIAVPDPVWERRFWWLFGIGMGIRLILALSLDLAPDEAYYWELSRRLDLSYFDHPPMVAYLIAMARKILGDTVLAVRLPALLGLAGLTRLVFLLGRDGLGRAEIGFGGAILLHTTLAGLALGFITTPDVPLALAWGMSAWAFVMILREDRVCWWFFMGLALGFGAMGKYNMIFFVPPVAITILGFAERRRLVFTGRFWLMVGLAFLGTIPILLWNNQHDWISFRFQFDHGLRPSQRAIWKNVGEFLGGQLLTVGFFVFPLLWFASFRAVVAGWRRNDHVRFFLGMLPLPMMVFFLYTGITSKVEANWPQVAYLTGMLLVAEWLSADTTRRRWRLVLAPNALMFILAIVQAMTLAIPARPTRDVSMRLHGWEQMGRIVRDYDRKTGGKLCFVGQGAPLAALLGFYGKLPPQRVAEIHGSGNWRFWWRQGSLATGSSLVYIDVDRHSEAPIYSRMFDRVSSTAYIIRSRGRVVRTINVSLMEDSDRELRFQPGPIQIPEGTQQ